MAVKSISAEPLPGPSRRRGTSSSRSTGNEVENTKCATGVSNDLPPTLVSSLEYSSHCLLELSVADEWKVRSMLFVNDGYRCSVCFSYEFIGQKKGWVTFMGERSKPASFHLVTYPIAY